MPRIEVLGSGTGTSPEMGNSSFLIWQEDKDEAYLMDCGFSVFSTLKNFENNGRKVIEKISNVFISHLHDDHVGSAGLLTIQRFINQKKPLNFVGAKINNIFKYTLKGCEDFYTTNPCNDFLFVKTVHVKGMESMGCLVNDVFYSGDTNKSLLKTPEARLAKVIVHEACLDKENAYHTTFAELNKAPLEIKKKTYIIHYPKVQYKELVEKAKANGFAGVLKEGDCVLF